METSLNIHQLTPADITLMSELLTLFGKAFNDPEAYNSSRPSAAYHQKLLGSGPFIALAALTSGKVIGGLAAYEFIKFEQERSEIYIYDLAVDENHRRQGVATALINELKKIARQRGAYVIYVQADYIDPPAIALYTKLGAREDVLHFDIPVDA
jgi:aminoglycoside 3-N-acetyltransferase I